MVFQPTTTFMLVLCLPLKSLKTEEVSLLSFNKNNPGFGIHEFSIQESVSEKAMNIISSKPPIKILYSCLTMLTLSLIFLIVFGYLQLPATSYTMNANSARVSSSGSNDPFSDLVYAFKQWDSEVGCAKFRLHQPSSVKRNNTSLQDPDGIPCELQRKRHVSVLVKGWTWIPDSLSSIHSCRCGLSCLWTKSQVLADSPDALLFETATPPPRRHRGEPLRVYMDLEAGRNPPVSDIFISYHAEDDVQTTYAGSQFHTNRNYYVSPSKNNDTLVYWSSSRCLPDRNKLARRLLSLLPHHSFGKCLNNVGGENMALDMYPECQQPGGGRAWSDHLHCAMSHYKFVLAIENTMTDSYVTEKLFYALDSGAVPIYFGAANVLDFVPPNSIIDGSKFTSLESLASYVKHLANDPVAYSEYHAWRRCGVMGNYHRTRAVSLDTLPCRLCAMVSKLDGRESSSN